MYTHTSVVSGEKKKNVLCLYLERLFRTEPCFSQNSASWQSAAQITASKDHAGQWLPTAREQIGFYFFKPYSRYRSHEVLDH